MNIIMTDKDKDNHYVMRTNANNSMRKITAFKINNPNKTILNQMNLVAGRIL
jgi:hypothetical protein